MVVLLLRDRLGKVLDRLAQRRQRRAVVQHDRLVKALRPTFTRHRHAPSQSRFITKEGKQPQPP
jgi:hypothetical protein